MNQVLAAILAIVVTAVVSAGGAWLYRGHIDKTALAAALAKSNAEAQAQIDKWQRAASAAASQYEADRAAQEQSDAERNDALASQPGGDKPLSPYLAHAAGLLYPGSAH